MSSSTQTVPDMGARRFKRYLDYKDSGVEWLGEIPKHWEVKRLRSTVTSCQNGLWGDEPDGVHDIACVRVADFDRISFRVDVTDPTFRSIEPNAASARGLRAGDLLLEKSGGGENQPVGAVVMFDHRMPAICSNFIARLTIAKGNDSRFLTYLNATLYAQRINTRHIKQSTGIQNLDSSSYLCESVGLPPESEQRAIAAFLDRETARIEALVAKKEKFIELLRERRTAIIEEIVRGDSESPERRLGYCVDLLPGYAFPSDAFSHDPDDIRLLRGANISPEGVLWDDTVHWPLSEATRFGAYCLREGDLVLGMDRPWVKAGIRVARVTASDLPSLLLQRVARLRAKKGLTQEYLMLILSSPQFRGYFEPILTGISVPHVSPEQVLSFRIRLPSLDVQKTAYQRAQTLLAQIKSMSNVLERSTAVLKELCTALMSDAVTGKIDVRGEVA